MGTWGRRSLARRCAHCGVPQCVGEPCYQGKHPEPFCLCCAARMLELEPPEDLPAYESPQSSYRPTVATEFARFNRKAMASRLRRGILDARERQAGEDRE